MFCTLGTTDVAYVVVMLSLVQGGVTLDISVLSGYAPLN